LLLHALLCYSLDSQPGANHEHLPRTSRHPRLLALQETGAFLAGSVWTEVRSLQARLSRARRSSRDAARRSLRRPGIIFATEKRRMSPDFANSIPRLKRLLPRFRKIRIGVLGDLMLDRYLWGTATRLSPEAPVPVVDFASQSDCLGGAGNVAANLAALRAHVEVFGVVGGRKTSAKQSSQKLQDDEAGGALRACLRVAKIGERGVLADAQRLTTVKTRIIALHQQIVRVDNERRDALAPETEEKLFRLLLSSLKQLDALVLSDYDKGLINEALMERVLNACHKENVPVFVRPKKSRRCAYPGARVVVCNTTEAGFYVTQELRDEH